MARTACGTGHDDRNRVTADGMLVGSERAELVRGEWKDDADIRGRILARVPALSDAHENID